MERLDLILLWPSYYTCFISNLSVTFHLLAVLSFTLHWKEWDSCKSEGHFWSRPNEIISNVVTTLWVISLTCWSSLFRNQRCTLEHNRSKKWVVHVQYIRVSPLFVYLLIAWWLTLLLTVIYVLESNLTDLILTKAGYRAHYSYFGMSSLYSETFDVKNLCTTEVMCND